MTKMLKLQFLIVLLTRTTLSSVVIDKWTPKGIHMTDYCPNMEYCEEGTHIMCMYFDPNHPMGPRCRRPKNATITPYLADKLVHTVNLLRSKVAKGVERGKGDTPLPRGFGMFKLSWDSELATFAQVLANQCLFQHDLCRATKKFPNPGQTMALLRFDFDDWMPVKNDISITTRGLTKQKLKYAVIKAVGQWYRQKIEVTPEMIKTGSITQKSVMYMRMIHGPLTHMGCGISAYSAYTHYTNGAPLNYNNIEVVCNFSQEPQPGQLIYQTDPPLEVDYTIECGCPPGYKEDEDCLCYFSPSPEHTCSSKESCDEAPVVLLPIITVEDAPPEKLKDEGIEDFEIPDLYPESETTSHHPDINHPYEDVADNRLIKEDNQDFDFLMNSKEQNQHHNVKTVQRYNENMKQNYTLPQSKYYRVTDYRTGNENKLSLYRSNSNIKPSKTGRNINNRKSTHSVNTKVRSSSVMSSLVNEVQRFPNLRYTEKPKTEKPVLNKVINRYYKDVVARHPFQLRTAHPSLKHILPRKESIFTKAAKFNLNFREDSQKKLDVQPRKDFSGAKSLVENYLRLRIDNDHHNEVSNQIIKTTKTHLINPEEKVMHSNDYLEIHSRKSPSNYIQDKNSLALITDKADDKLMTLLDKLEQEVKNIELDNNKKEIFDAKIRKIYGTVLGSPLDTDTLSDLESIADKEAHLTDKIHTPYDDEGFRKMFNNEIRHTRYHNDLHEVSNNFKNDNSNTFNYDEMKIKSYKGKDCVDEEIKRRHMKTDNKHKDGNEYNPNIATGRRLNDINRVLEDNYDDLLSIDRRKYYQEKLENLERKLKKSRYRHDNDDNNRKLRPVKLSTREEKPLRPSKSSLDLYMPDGARFLHGF